MEVIQVDQGGSVSQFICLKCTVFFFCEMRDELDGFLLESRVIFVFCVLKLVSACLKNVFFFEYFKQMYAKLEIQCLGGEVIKPLFTPPQKKKKFLWSISCQNIFGNCKYPEQNMLDVRLDICHFPATSEPFSEVFS